MIRARMAAVTLSTALLVIACDSGAGDDAANPVDTEAPLSAATIMPAAPAPTTSTSAVPASVPVSLQFTAKTLNGDTFDGASLAGKPVVFWFWAPWCPKCLSEAPAVKAAADMYKDVAFVGVAGLDTEAAMTEFVLRTGTGDIIQLSDEKGAVWTKLEISAQSTFVFMKPDGSTAKAFGPLDSGELAGHIHKLVAG